MIWVIPFVEIENFDQHKIMSSQLQSCWETLVESLPQNLKDEVFKKGLSKIELHSINRLVPNSRYKVLRFIVPEASPELEKILNDNENTILSN